MTLDIFFQGIASPARLIGTNGLADLLSDLAFGWPFTVATADTSKTPFFSISAIADSDLLVCENHILPVPARKLDTLNALCDLVAALAYALPNSDARLICLHAAAVVVGGELLIFPNVRRAGKSTLAVALAQAGHGLVGDDVVPLSFDAQGQGAAHALGISPRLRLPLPDTMTPAFRDWVQGAEGERNHQYHYIRIPDQPRHGKTFPVGAFVILDRQESPVPARIEPVSSDKAMDVIMFQNFTRDRHSGDVLRAMAAMLGAKPVLRLVYADLESAVRCLEAAFPRRSDPAAAQGPGPALPFRMPDLRPYRGPDLHPLAKVAQRAGTECQMIGETLYLADPEGQAIRQMDPLAAVIWGLISEPSTETELVEILTAAFPETDRGQIAADLTVLLRNWAASGLIEVVPAG